MSHALILNACRRSRILYRWQCPATLVSSPTRVRFLRPSSGAVGNVRYPTANRQSRRVPHPLIKEDTTKSPAIYRPLVPEKQKPYTQRLSKLPSTIRRAIKRYRLTDLGIHSRMKSHLQIITTPTSDTSGTALYLHFDDKRYVFGNVHEGLQRAGLQAGAKFLKAKDVFLTGKTEWKNTGGLLGMMLTLADGEKAAAASKGDSIKQRLKRAEAREEAQRQKSKKAGKVVNQDTGNPGETALVEDNPSLRVHGGPNLLHTVATARSFIFRQGMPIDVEEYPEDHGQKGDKHAWTPSFVDNRIQLWAMPIKPTETSLTRPASPRKRSLGEFMEGQLPTRNEVLEQWGVQTDKKPDNYERDQAIRRKAVSEMFKSEWRYDNLEETLLREVKLPAGIFVRNPETKRLSKYTGPMPEDDPSAPNITVLVRQPWPGALINHLPPTQPSPAAMSYIVRGHKQRGKFKPHEARRLGVVPGPQFSRLSQGESVRLENGNTVTPDMVLEPSRDGGGFAIIDLPSSEYIPALLQRPEWRQERVMTGIEFFIWLLGPGLHNDESLLKFMQEFEDIKHVVSSREVCGDKLMMRSAASESARHRRIDPDRHPAIRHDPDVTIEDGEPDKSNSATVLYSAARQGLKLQLQPSSALDTSDIPHINERSKEKEMPEEALTFAHEARNAIASESVQSELAAQNLPSPDAEIICLGTGSALPSLHRNVSATLLRVPGSGSYLIDCGENTLGQLRRLYSESELDDILKDLKLIWISHLHADHHLGTTSVIKAWYEIVYGPQAGEFVTRRGCSPRSPSIEDLADAEGQKLFVIAHSGMMKWLKEYSTVEDFGYEHIVPLTTREPQMPYTSPSCLEWNGMDLGFHGRDANVNQFSIQKATGLADLQYCYVSHCHGALAVSLTFPTGFKFSYSGDCRPSRAFAKIGNGSTVLLHEATFDDDTKDDAIAKKHSTISEAIGVGVAMGARRVLLTHFSQRYSKLPSMDDIDKASLKLEDAEDVSDPDQADMIAPVDAPPTPGSGPSESESQNPNESGSAVVAGQGQGTQSHLSEPDKDMKVGVAFDYMRVKVKDIALLEKFTPAMRELYRDREEEVSERPGSAASMQPRKPTKS